MAPTHKSFTFPPRTSMVSVTAVVLAGTLIFVLGMSFIHQHHYLNHAVTLHSQALRLEMKETDWQVVWSLAKMSRGREEFFALLKTEGMLETDEGDDPGSDTLTKDEPASGNTSGSIFIGNSSSKSRNNERRRNDYGSLSVLKNGPRDGADGDQDYGQRAAVAEKDGIGRDGSSEYYGDDDKEEEEKKSTQPVDGGPPPMSARLARAQAVNNTVIVTWANYALWDFVKSWVRHVQELGITNFLVGAMDQQIGEAMVKAGIPCFAMYEPSHNHSGVGSDHLAWGGESFHKMGRQKITLAKMFLDVDINLLLVDVDVVILLNVLKYFERFPEADILVSTDHLMSTLEAGDQGLELPYMAGSPMNIGIMFFRNNANTTRFVNEWLDAINARPDYWDQLAFNDLARAGWDPYVKVHPNNKRVFIGFNGSLAVGVLPTASFLGGHNYYIQRLYEIQHVQPMAVHCTFQYGGNVGKRNRMRESMIFFDEEEYYTGENYISIDLKKVPNMGSVEFNMSNYTQMKAYNVKGLYMQLESVNPAIGMSHLFKRPLIMPKLACYCDRSWMPLNRCRLPGADQQRLPFMCPMDYVLDPDGLTDDASNITIKWREQSFLNNARCPQSVKDSRLTIYTSKAYKTPMDKYIVQDGGPVLLLPAGLGSKELDQVMSKYKEFKVWHFRDAAATFTTFDDPETAEQYKRRLARLVPVTQPEKTKEGIPM